MAILRIKTDKDPILRKTSRPVEEINPRIRTLAKDMIDTLHKADGVGLAAVQVGVLRRIIVVETDPGNPIVMINPEILESSGEQDGPEGCLSVPGKRGEVKRPNYVKVKAMDLDGNYKEYEGTELFARCVFHETDHLDGILYTDKAWKMINPDEED
ncbi:MAG: peptide deformylase [Clostridiales bacterium]|nr:peptide deformylase [Clostridiales bacterium]